MNGWQTRPLGEVCGFQRGLTYSKSDEVDRSHNVVLRAMNIDLASHLLDFAELKYISDQVVVPPSKKVQKDSLLICTASGSKTHLGKIAFIDHDYGYAFGGFMGMLTPNADVVPKYLFHLMTSEAYEDFIGALAAGMNINNLKFDDLRQFPVAYPPVPEQQRIVGILDEALAAIAAARVNTEQNLRNARELFRSHIDTVFAQGVEQWPAKPLGELCTILDNQRIPITKRDRASGDIPYYGATGVQDHVHGFIFDEPLVLVGEDGAKWGPGEVSAYGVSGKCWVNNHAHVLRPDPHILLDSWLIYFLNRSDLTEFVSGLTVQKLNQGNLREIPVPVPPLSVQSRLTKAALDVELETQRLVSIYERKLAALDALKQSLLHQAFTGAL